ncbi:KpsF/GutQ family sugar-phosphate isomerase, partial [Bacteriovoracaceae bacterium]|nr:KpsF/GutQ family sugar-phosphate isomerase [Bacteriovoracaceae bacterium]
VIISGMGKSGIIGRKISATLSSTGTPSFFLHPGEAYHGDLGVVTQDDLVVLISHSGETEEVLKLIPFLKSNENSIAGFTSNKNSTLGKNSDFVIQTKVTKEACPLELAPTTSTTVTLALGDALAMTLMDLRNFKAEQFAKFHPGGSLGRRLLTTVRDIMRSTDIPVIEPNEKFMSVLNSINNGRLGITIVCEDAKADKKKFIGVITDGDLRRSLNKFQDQILNKSAEELMSPKPKTIAPDLNIAEVENQMKDHKISVLLVSEDATHLTGLVQIYDFYK